MYYRNIQFSDTAKNELGTITKKVDSFTNGVYNMYNTDAECRDLDKLIELLKEEDTIVQLRKTYKKNHLKRVDNELYTVPIRLVFIELLNTLEKIADNTYTIAKSMVYNNNLI